MVYTNYEKQYFEPEKLKNADRDPYEVPDGEVEVKIDEGKGFQYKEIENP